MTKEIQSGNNRFAFIPRRLEIEDRPELADFPLNVLFVNYFSLGGVDYSATALYKPDLDSYREEEEGGGTSMDYRNIHGPENTITIKKEEEKWIGIKSVKGSVALIAEGQTWSQFFAQLTIMGLSKGERCEYKPLLQKNLRN